MLDHATVQPSDQQLLDEFSSALDLVEDRVPMRASYSRIDPYILECDQAEIRFRFLIYHRESHLWFGTPERKDAVLQHVADFSLVKRGDTVFDLGCNSGFLTTWFAKKVGSTGRVLAFDPFPWNTLATSFSARLNSCQNVECLTIGIADADRFVTIPIVDSKTDENPKLTAHGTFEAELVPLDRFAAYLPQFIKVDIEGAERHLLAGAAALLSQSPKPIWFLEIHNQFIRNAGSDPDQIPRVFLAHGYDCRIHHPRGGIFQTDNILPEGCALFALPNS
ncbi:MAG: hypothetical protein JWN70_4453 [Planctomycetaceae bacterium]|nr:hypothetical protein [Planctomycetaceae bacterium]